MRRRAAFGEYAAALVAQAAVVRDAREHRGCARLRDRRRRVGGRLPRRPPALTTAAATVLWLGVTALDDLRCGFRFGAVTDGPLPDLFGGFLFAMLLTLEFRHRRPQRRLAGVGRPADGPSAQECLDVLG
ncbi:hypothetical protein [Streptomyces sp. NPDC096311]|uniref:hypothetical protein n=1 Tax=Streptomyces sp. NPDC096311 TaxID=3366083 RepID=UPI00380B25AD